MRPLNPYQTTASVQALAAQQPPAAACAADEEERQRLEGAAGAFARRAARGSKLSSSFSLREQILWMDVKSQPLLVLARESSDNKTAAHTGGKGHVGHTFANTGLCCFIN